MEEEKHPQAEKEHPARNAIAWLEIGILAGIIIPLAAIGFGLLNSNINNVHTSLTTNINTVQSSLNTQISNLTTNVNTVQSSLTTQISNLNTSMNERIDGLSRLERIAPVPTAAKLPPEKIKKIPKSQLLAAKPLEQIVTVGAGDYVVLPVQFEFGETAIIRWQSIGEPEKNPIDFYLMNEAGNIYRYIRSTDYSSTWIAPNEATFYLYFSNTFEPTQSKELWFQLMEPGGP